MPSTLLGDVVRRFRDIAPEDPTHQLRQNLLLARDEIVSKYRKILTMWPWSFLEKENNTITTSSGVLFYPLAVDFRWIISCVNVTNSSPMRPKPLRWMEAADPQRIQLGPPYFYTTWAVNTLRTFPIADGAYNLRYLYVSDGTTYPVGDQDPIRIDPVDCLVYGALADLCASLADSQKSQALEVAAQRWDQKFQTSLQEAIDEDRPRVTLPDSPDDQDDGITWWNQDMFRQLYWGPLA